MFDLVVSTVPADGFAPDSAKPSTGTVMTNFESPIQGTHTRRGRLTHMRQSTKPSLGQIMACRLFGTEPLSKPTLAYCYV